MNVVSVPAELNERTFDALVGELDDAASGRVLIDARHLRWVDPYGMIGLLAVGRVAGRRGERPRIQLPESADVRGYIGRMGFYGQAHEIFEMHGPSRRSVDAESDVLLEITPIRSHDDVHTVVDRVNERAQTILRKQLHYPAKEAFQFSVILSEVCQNIVEHAEADGWVATQTYNRLKHLDRKVVKIAVMDLGVGFRGSLASAHAGRFGDKWGDATALEATFMHGLTRFPDPGRGQGIQQIRRRVGRWGGKFSVRSGTARIADVPDWENAVPLEEDLPDFPGAQISIILPEQQQEAA